MDLDTVVGRLADLLERPLVLYDCDLSMAAYSAHEEVDDAPRLRAILSRHATPHAREMLRAHGAASSTAPVRLPAAAGSPERIAVGVRHDGRLMGYLVWIEPGASHEIPDAVRELVSRYGPEMGRLLAERALDSQEERLRLRVLISDLVSDDTRRRSEAARALIDNGTLPAVSQYTCIVVAASDRAEASTARRRTLVEATLSGLSRRTRETVAGAVIGDEGIAVLARGSTQLRLAARPDDAAAPLIGIGDPVPDLARALTSVRQARIAVHGGQRDPDRYGRVIAWADLGLDRLLLQLPLDQLTVDDLPSPVISLLDAASGPDLADTLETYLSCGGDAQETARRLTIHRSTLYYRLDRLQKITGADLHDGDVRRELHTALRVARLAGLAPRQANGQHPAATPRPP